MKYERHDSVLLDECLEYLAPEKNRNLSYLDLTFGAGGHTLAFIKKYKVGLAVAVDQDLDAIKNSQKIIKENNIENVLKIHHMNFSEFLKNNKEKFDIILADLGVSSHHFDSAERGFSFRKDAPLDMRMNQSQELDAKMVLNEFPEDDLVEIIKSYGEERFAGRIAGRVVEARKLKIIETTAELEEICFLSYPKQLRHKKTHPATRTFQALRIYVNRELDVLKSGIPLMISALKENGKLGIISFHSLEDRIVKHSFKETYQKDRKSFKILTKKPLTASEDEIQENARARSAKLRVIQKLVYN